MIEVEYRDRMGNNLFQYCFGRLLAERLGFYLSSPPIRGFPQTYEPRAGLRYAGPEVVVTDDDADVERLVADRTPRKIIVRGYFQKAALYQPSARTIREDWLALAPRDIRVLPAADEIWVHVRRGDYMGWGSALPFSYYESAIQSLGGKNVRIVTDDPYDPFLLRFRKFKAAVVPGSELDDFHRLTQAKKLVLSQSSYSWWAAFLSDAHEVVCPLPVAGIWATQTSLRMADPRYRYIESPEPYRPSIIELAYIKYRHAQFMLRAMRARKGSGR